MGVIGSNAAPEARAVLANTAGDVVSGSSTGNTGKAMMDGLLEHLQKQSSFNDQGMQEQNKILNDTLSTQKDVARMLEGVLQSSTTANPRLMNAQTTVNK